MPNLYVCAAHSSKEVQGVYSWRMKTGYIIADTQEEAEEGMMTVMVDAYNSDEEGWGIPQLNVRPIADGVIDRYVHMREEKDAT